MAESAHNRLVTLLDADPGLAALSGRELGALVGVKACAANLYRRQWQRGEGPRPWGVNVRRDNGPCCYLCTVLEAENEPLVKGLCIPCWWRLDGGNLYDYRHGLDEARWERLRIIISNTQKEKI